MSLSSKSASIKPRFVAMRAEFIDSKEYLSVHGQPNYWPYGE